MEERPRPTIVISGSFRKHFSSIQEKIREFEELGVSVLSPRDSKVTNPGEEFVLLESDGSTDAETLERRHLEAIHEADALYIYNPEGYIGASATLELGWALAFDKPIYGKEVAADFTLSMFCGVVASPRQIRDELLARRSQPLRFVHPRSSIAKLQAYVEMVCVQRGFESETATDIMLLMCEEMGELAKALRKRVGLKVDQSKMHEFTQVHQELADVFIYLLHLANVCGIDLFDAFKKKEEVNSKRTWA